MRGHNTALVTIVQKSLLPSRCVAKKINQILAQACVALLALGFVSGQQQQQEGGHRRDQVNQQLDPKDHLQDLLAEESHGRERT